MNRPYRTRINIDLPTPLYKAMKQYCADRGLTLTKFIIKVILFFLRDIKRPAKR